MSFEEFCGYYILIGLFVAIINGAIRKMEADGLLGLVWILAWPMTPLALLCVLIINMYCKLRKFQPIRRTKIHLLRYF